MAETITYTYDSGSDPTSSWTNPSRAYDGSASTYANRAIAASTNETDKYILFSGHTGTSIPNWQITKVEVGVRRQDKGGASVHCEFKPVFGGSSDGPTHALSRTSTLSTVYIDITSDAGAPSPWTNTDIQNLDVKVWGNNSSASALNTRLAEVYIRITYTALYYAKEGTAITRDEFDNSTIDNPPWTESYQTGGSAVESGSSIVITAGEGSITTSVFQGSGIYQTIASGNFDIIMKISTYDTLPSSQNGGISLFLYVDADTWFGFRIRNYGGLQLYSFYKDGASYGEYTGSLSSNKPIYVRLARTSTTVISYYSTNGSTWTQSDNYTSGMPTAGGSLWISVNKATEASFTATIDYIINAAVKQSPINIYRDNTAMSHYLAMRVGGETLYALASTVGEANESALRVRIDGTTYSIKTQR